MVTFRGWPGDRLRERVLRELGLEVEEGWVFIEKTTVSRVWWKTGPLVIAEKGGKWLSLAGPALAVADGVLLSLFLLVAVATEGAGIR